MHIQRKKEIKVDHLTTTLPSNLSAFCYTKQIDIDVYHMNRKDQKIMQTLQTKTSNRCSGET